ncbi:hypothetical protein WMY93_007263 [Mugilogobius chulae]|uniref:Secreted frizzled-related protein 1 n=1 Tax=Mugilogobius chulae TaxID=88201 RepID=A0AAW0PTE5_9GOBI
MCEHLYRSKSAGRSSITIYKCSNGERPVATRYSSNDVTSVSYNLAKGDGPCCQVLGTIVKACPPCDNEMKADNIMEHYCASDFALKMKIKEVKKEKGDKKVIAAQKKKKVLKQGALRKKDLKKLTLYIKNGANCPCAQLDSLGSNFLIMGRKVDQQLLIMSIHKWDKKSKELKFAIKYMKSHQCPTYHTVFQ